MGTRFATINASRRLSSNPITFESDDAPVKMARGEEDGPGSLLSIDMVAVALYF